MFPLSLSNLIPPAVSFALALMLTPLVRMLARRWGFVAKPKTDRWHKNSTAMMGGVAIWLAVAGTYLFLVPHSPQRWVWWVRHVFCSWWGWLTTGCTSSLIKS